MYTRPKMIDFRTRQDGKDDQIDFADESYFGFIDVSYRESNPTILEHIVEFRVVICGVPVRLSHGQARELWAKWLDHKPNRNLLDERAYEAASK